MRIPPSGFLARINHCPTDTFRLTLGGRRIGVCSLDRLLYVLLHKMGIMGRRDFAFFRAQIRPGMTVVDVGANIGLYSLVFSELVGETGTVLALEPHPALFAQLSANLRKNRTVNVIPHAVAAGAGAGTHFFRQNPLNSGDNSLVPDGADPAGCRTVTVMALDDLAGERPIDWVKIDVQGWEPAVLAGMTGILARNRNLKICIEFSPSDLRKAGADARDFLAHLGCLGMTIFLPGQRNSLTAKQVRSLSRTPWYTNLVVFRP